jgi:hypothetical protein
MSGPAAHYVYTADDGTAYSVKIPVWEANLADHAATIGQTATLATTEPPLPTGIRRRKRYYQITATGKEGSFTVLSAISSINTAAIGHVLQVPLFNSVVAADNATLRGRTGERTKMT